MEVSWRKDRMFYQSMEENDHANVRMNQLDSSSADVTSSNICREFVRRIELATINFAEWWHKYVTHNNAVLRILIQRVSTPCRSVRRFGHRVMHYFQHICCSSCCEENLPKGQTSKFKIMETLRWFHAGLISLILLKFGLVCDACKRPPSVSPIAPINLSCQIPNDRYFFTQSVKETSPISLRWMNEHFHWYT